MSALGVRDELREFGVRLLERAGGVVDWPEGADAGDAVVPDEVAELLRVPEEFRLADEPRPDALNVGLAGDFLDLAEQVLQARVPRVVRLSVGERYLKSGGLQDAIDEAFAWHNARVRVLEAAPRTVEYHAWWFLAELRSEETWESRLGITLNAESLAAVELRDPFELPGVAAGEGPLEKPPETLAAAAAALRRRVLSSASAFLSRLDGRRARDQKRLKDYYQALVREAKNPGRRVKTVPTSEELLHRGRAVQLELGRKLAELDERYALECRLTPLALAVTHIVSLAIELDVQRKQAHRRYTAYWNPLLKQVEPLRCARCGVATHSITCTNDAVDLLCTPCSSSPSPPPAEARAHRKPR